MIGLRMQWLLAIALGTMFVVLPNAVRDGIEIDKIVAAVVWVTVDGWLLALALRWGDRHSVPIGWTLAAAYAAVIVFGAAYIVTIIGTGLVKPSHTPTSTTLGGLLADGAFSSMLVLGIWGLLYVIPRVVRDTRDHERERQELLRDTERARVRAALEPHFVLNTLTAIGALVRDEPDTVRELIGDLGDLLRDVVQLSDRDRQSAADEVAWLQRYARILEARHRGLLDVEFHLDPAAASVQVPILVLQPLVENAIQHGALQRAGGGRVRVDLCMVSDRLRCTIEDNGPGFARDADRDAAHDGPHGISLTRRRLASSVPGASLAIETAAPVGTRAVLVLPGAA